MTVATTSAQAYRSLGGITVAELILALQAMPDKDAEVLYGDGDCYPVAKVTPNERVWVIRNGECQWDSNRFYVVIG